MACMDPVQCRYGLYIVLAYILRGLATEVRGTAATPVFVIDDYGVTMLVTVHIIVDIDAGHRSYYRGLTMLLAVHIRG